MGRVQGDLHVDGGLYTAEMHTVRMIKCLCTRVLGAGSRPTIPYVMQNIFLHHLQPFIFLSQSNDGPIPLLLPP